MYCSNCGAKASGNFCFECGHKLTEKPSTQNKKPSDSQSEGSQNFLGLDLGAYNKALGNALSMQKEYEQTGKLDGDMISQLKSGFGFGSILQDLDAASKKQDAEIKEQKARLKKARADIGKRICPECRQKFKKAQSSCKHCGASVLIESYEEY